MAGIEFIGLDKAVLGEGPAAGETLFELGMKYSVGIEVPVDLISAHMWFNLAAAKGNAEFDTGATGVGAAVDATDVIGAETERGVEEVDVCALSGFDFHGVFERAE